MRRFALLGAAALLASISLWCFRNLGFWLVLEDPPVKAQAVFVLGGDPPFRAMEAAALYQQGWASEVWLAPEGRRKREKAFARLGMDYPGEHAVNRAALIRLGVPETAIRILDEAVWDTFDEVTAATVRMARTGADTLIITTSQYHTRRVRLLWSRLARPGQKLVVRATWQNGFRAGAWWQSSGDILSVAREIMGMANVVLGSPVRANPGWATAAL
jgi:uncharacterized SAM-binding protein YcdF (DUF218 family)